MQGTGDEVERLIELELVEIPRLREALAAWPDDAYLADELHRDEAEVRELTARVTATPSDARASV
jgi:hypothetical protein